MDERKTNVTKRDILKKGAKILIKDWKMLIVFLLLLSGPVIVVVNLIFSIKDQSHYLRNKDNAIVVTAIVTYHGTVTDSDGDDSYISCISYNVDGIEYKNIRFEESRRYSKLTELGEQVTVEVSPENPALLMSHLKSSGGMIWVYALILVSVVVVPRMNFRRKR